MLLVRNSTYSLKTLVHPGTTTTQSAMNDDLEDWGNDWEPEPDTDSDDCRWDRHESLSAAERNPSLLR